MTINDRCTSLTLIRKREGKEAQMNSIMKHSGVRILFVVAVMAVSGCGKTTPETVPSRPLISRFWRMENLTVRRVVKTNILGIFGGGPVSDQENLRLRKQYGDSIWRPSGYRVQDLVIGCYCNEFTSISITSDKQFNDFPAGADLSPAVTLMAISPYKWLNSNGEEEYDWSWLDKIPEESRGNVPLIGVAVGYPWCHFISKPLTEIRPEDLVLMELENIRLVFTETPQIKEHTLTVTLWEGDTPVTGTIEMVFE